MANEKYTEEDLNEIIAAHKAAWAAKLNQAIRMEREECARACSNGLGTMSMYASVADMRAAERAINGCISRIRARG